MFILLMAFNFFVITFHKFNNDWLLDFSNKNNSSEKCKNVAKIAGEVKDANDMQIWCYKIWMMGVYFPRQKRYLSNTESEKFLIRSSAVADRPLSIIRLLVWFPTMKILVLAAMVAFALLLVSLPSADALKCKKCDACETKGRFEFSKFTAL